MWCSTLLVLGNLSSRSAVFAFCLLTLVSALVADVLQVPGFLCWSLLHRGRPSCLSGVPSGAN